MRMSLSVELGRAVIDAPTTNHELWLTTLIAISPKQDAAYIAQFTPSQCLETLASGDFWVHRGHDMHMDLKLTLHNKALPHKQIQDLTQAILQAPIWHQLRLRPSLPSDAVTEPGTVRLIINHGSTTGKDMEQKRHRLFPHMPVVDLQPPEGVMSASLQSVRLSMDILQIGPRRRRPMKQSNPSLCEQKDTRPEAEDVTTDVCDVELTEEALGGHASRPDTIAASRKRKRSVTDMSATSLEASNEVVTPSEIFVHAASKSTVRKLLASTVPSQVDVLAMVDSALRLSIKGTMNKLPHGLKAKASTFRLGLADIAPALWRDGYADALSHRAQLTPTIARSLSQVANSKILSVSLKSKMESLGILVYVDRQDNHTLKGTLQLDVTRLSSCFENRLWSHSQRALLNHPTLPIQACINFDFDKVDSDSDDMLSERGDQQSDDIHGMYYHAHVQTDSSKLYDGRSVLLSARPAAIDDSHQGQPRRQYHRKSPTDVGIEEAEEEILFDSLPQKYLCQLSTPEVIASPPRQCKD